MWGNKRMRVCGFRGSGVRLNGQIGEVSAFDLHCVEESAARAHINRPTSPSSLLVETGLRGGSLQLERRHLELAGETKVGHGVLSL